MGTAKPVQRPAHPLSPGAICALSPLPAAHGALSTRVWWAQRRWGGFRLTLCQHAGVSHRPCPAPAPTSGNSVLQLLSCLFWADFPGQLGVGLVHISKSISSPDSQSGSPILAPPRPHRPFWPNSPLGRPPCQADCHTLVRFITRQQGSRGMPSWQSPKSLPCTPRYLLPATCAVGASPELSSKTEKFTKGFEPLTSKELQAGGWELTPRLVLK